MGNTAAHQLQSPIIPPEVAPIHRLGPWLRPSGWVSFLFGALAGVSWLAALAFAVDGAALLPSWLNTLRLRLALWALLSAIAPLIVLMLAWIKRQRLAQRNTQPTRARMVFAVVAVLTLLCLVPAVLALMQLPQAGAYVDSLAPIFLAFILSSPMLSLGVALAILSPGTQRAPAIPETRRAAPVMVAACGFGFVSIALGIAGVITIITAPAPDCTGQHLGCGAIANALIGETLILVCFGSLFVFILALIEGMLGYYISAILTEWLQSRS